MPQGCLRFVIVVFPDHTHYFCHLSQLLTNRRRDRQRPIAKAHLVTLYHFLSCSSTQHSESSKARTRWPLGLE